MISKLNKPQSNNTIIIIICAHADEREKVHKNNSPIQLQLKKSQYRNIKAVDRLVQNCK